MLERLKELFRHSAVYGLGSIVARILGVLLLPLYTRYLSPSDYGLIETLVALSAVLSALVAQAHDDLRCAGRRLYLHISRSGNPRERARHRAEIDAGHRHHVERRRVMLGHVQAVDAGLVGRGGELQALVEEGRERAIAPLHVIEQSDFHAVSGKDA